MIEVLKSLGVGLALMPAVVVPVLLLGYAAIHWPTATGVAILGTLVVLLAILVGETARGKL